MKRRSYLTTCIAGLAVTAGCTSGDSGESPSTTADSDGDGVPDSEDYAPRDPDVQSEEDVAGAATTATRTTAPSQETTTTTATTTTTRTTTTVGSDRHDIHVENSLQDGESQVTAYGADGLTARVYPNGPSVSEMAGKRVKLLAFAYTYPRDTGVEYGVSEPFDLDQSHTATAPVDISGVSDNTRLHYLAFLLPADLSLEDAESSDLVFFHETDGFSLRDGEAQRNPHPEALDDESTESFERNAVEGAYSLSLSGRTAAQSWESTFYIYKSSYIEMLTTARGRSRPEYVSYSIQNGFAGELATLLSEEAAENDITEKREKAEFIIDFVQRLPYVPDDVSTGFDDYTKFLTETLVEGGGDCEDTAVMLAAILQAEPFGYDMVLIQPPGHMAAGVYGTDLPGYYWETDGRKYYYIETTGEGWGVGDIPDEYRNSKAYVYQV